MPLTAKDLYTSQHSALLEALKLAGYSADEKWTAVAENAKALANADSWSIFCMDCAGEMSTGDYKKVQVA